MGEATNTYPDLNEQAFRLNKINKMKYYFIDDIRERELID